MREHGYKPRILHPAKLLSVNAKKNTFINIQGSGKFTIHNELRENELNQKTKTEQNKQTKKEIHEAVSYWRNQ